MCSVIDLIKHLDTLVKPQAPEVHKLYEALLDLSVKPKGTYSIHGYVIKVWYSYDYPMFDIEHNNLKRTIASSNINSTFFHPKSTPVLTPLITMVRNIIYGDGKHMEPWKVN